MTTDTFMPKTLLVGEGYFRNSIPLYAYAVARLIDEIVLELPADDFDPQNSLNLRVCTPDLTVSSNFDNYLFAQKERAAETVPSSPSLTGGFFDRLLAMQHCGTVSYELAKDASEKKRLKTLMQIAKSHSLEMSDEGAGGLHSVHAIPCNELQAKRSV